VLKSFWHKSAGRLVSAGLNDTELMVFFTYKAKATNVVLESKAKAKAKD